KGERGQINGLATTGAGLVAITLGVGIRVVGGGDLAPTDLAWILGAGAALWVAVAAVYASIREPADDGTLETASAGSGDGRGGFRPMLRLLRDDRPFRHFVGVRSLLLVSALSPPFVVTLSIQSGAAGLAGLGGFVIASGVA